MIRSIKHLRGYDISAKDGELGDVHDIFFDDHSWKARYLVVDTGNWLPGRRVIVSPGAIGAIDDDKKTLALHLTKDEIKNSPGVEADAPVSRQNEIALAEHFSWPRYWEEYPSGMGMTPMIPHLQHAAAGTAPRAQDDHPLPHGDPDLRSATEVEGYHVAANDGDIGHVDDLLFDDSDWTLRFIVADTRNWWPGKKVLVAPAWTQGIDWGREKLHVAAARETIKAAPTYETGMVIDGKLEARIFEHYGHRPQAAE